MTATSRLDIKQAWHIALASSNAAQHAERFWNVLGVGPWSFMTIKCPKDVVRLHGKPVALEVRAAMTQIGFLGFGYDQPLTTPSPFDDMLKKRDGGAHHLAFVVDDIEQGRTHMQRLGYEEVLAGTGIGPNKDGAGCYFDTVEDMGTIIELSQLPSEMPGIEGVFPAHGSAGPASGIKVRGAAHVAIAVRDAEGAARHYQEVFGVGPWQVASFTAPALYLGKPVQYSAKVALVSVGSFVLVLEQPVSTPGPLQDFIDRNGQGIHHVCLEVDDTDGAWEEMRRLGYGATFVARDFGPNKDGQAAYFDTEAALGIVIELARPPTGDLFA